jgi:hypothetical protein
MGLSIDEGRPDAISYSGRQVTFVVPRADAAVPLEKWTDGPGFFRSGGGSGDYSLNSRASSTHSPFGASRRYDTQCGLASDERPSFSRVTAR